MGRKCIDCGSVMVYNGRKMVCPKCMIKDAKKGRCAHCLFLDKNRKKWHCLFYRKGEQPKPENCEYVAWRG